MSLIAWGVFARLWSVSPAAQRPALLACLVFATAGEVFLSLVWGLYDYRLGNIPLFVAPGHVLIQDNLAKLPESDVRAIAEYLLRLK